MWKVCAAGHSPHHFTSLDETTIPFGNDQVVNHRPMLACQACDGTVGGPHYLQPQTVKDAGGLELVKRKIPIA